MQILQNCNLVNMQCKYPGETWMSSRGKNTLDLSPVSTFSLLKTSSSQVQFSLFINIDIQLLVNWFSYTPNELLGCVFNWMAKYKYFLATLSDLLMKGLFGSFCVSSIIDYCVLSMPSCPSLCIIDYSAYSPDRVILFSLHPPQSSFMILHQFGRHVLY